MANYDFRTLSPIDFEDLVRDLLQADESVRLESFGPGRDQGVDFRFAAGGNRLIVQAKHYTSGFDAVLGAVKLEDSKVQKLAPSRYILATSVSLNPTRKAKLIAALPSAPLSEGDVLGREDLNNLLGKHPAVERRHFKLWLASTTVLERIVHSRLYNRTEHELDEIREIVPRFVDNDSVPQALRILRKEGALIVSGEPGVGKSTLARMLIWMHAQAGWQITVIDDITDAFTLGKVGERHLVFFDDFLGQVRLTPDWIRSVDQRLPPFLRKARSSPDLRFVMTTRDYILRQAQQQSDRLGGADLKLTEFVLNVGTYTRSVRARMLYNHIFFSELTKEEKAALLDDEFYLTIINHRNYNPRIISLLTSRDFLALNEPDVRHLVVRVLNDPAVLWEKPYRSHISDDGRALMLALLFNRAQVSIAALKATFTRLCLALGYPTSTTDLTPRFREAVRALEGSVVALERQIVRFGNPGVRDFLQRVVVEDGQLLGIAARLETFNEVQKAWEIWSGSPNTIATARSQSAWATSASAMMDSATGTALDRLALVMQMTPGLRDADAESLTTRALDDLENGEIEGEEAEMLSSMLDELQFPAPVPQLGARTRHLLTAKGAEMLENYGAALTLETIVNTATALVDHGDVEIGAAAGRAGLNAYLEDLRDVLSEIGSHSEFEEFEIELKSAVSDWGAGHPYMESRLRDRREEIEERESRDDGEGGGWSPRQPAGSISDDGIRNMFSTLR